ncbi:MAG: FMN-binding protein [Limnochordales bacterium]|nr:FMN-binding protein [Limnochordales bacterium]
MKRFSKWRVLGLAAVAVLIVGIAMPLIGRTAGKIYKDGIYVGISDADDHGYGMATVNIKDDKIVSVVLSEVTEKGVPKDYNTYTWQPVKDARNQLTKQFVAVNGTKVDIYAKATHSSKKWIQAVERALSKARLVPESKNKYFDGTFFGKSSAGEHGYAVAWVTIKNDKITSVRLEEVTKTGEFKDWKNYSYKIAVEARDIMQKRFIGKSSPEEIEKIDVVAKATHSGEMYKEAVIAALKAAQRQ